MGYERILELFSTGIGLVGVAILVWGVAGGLCRLVVMELRAARGVDQTIARRGIRHHVSYYLLLSLEFLVAADIIETLLAPTLEHMAILGGIVLIRTVISFSLNWEMSREELQNKPV